jgi:hypothetical protein
MNNLIVCDNSYKTLLTATIRTNIYEDCPECIRPFWIIQQPGAWPWYNLAVGRKRPYCASVKSLSRGTNQSAVKRRWLSLCTICPSNLQWPIEQIRFATTLRLPILQPSCRLSWQSITSPRSVSPSKAQIRVPATSGFFQSQSPLKVRRFVNATVSHNTQTKSTACHCRLTKPTEEWLFTDKQ